MREILRARVARALIVVALVALSGCVTGPYNDQVINANGIVSFQGFHPEPGAEIRIEVYIPILGRFVQVGTPATAQTVEWDESFSRPLYAWNKTITIPALAFVNKRARVRIEGPQGSLITYSQAGRQCMEDNYEAYLGSNSDEAFNVDDNGIDCSRNTNGGSIRTELYLRKP